VTTNRRPRPRRHQPRTAGFPRRHPHARAIRRAAAGQKRRCRHGYTRAGAPPPPPPPPPSDRPPRLRAPPWYWRRCRPRAGASCPSQSSATAAGVADSGRVAPVRPDSQWSQRRPRPAVVRASVTSARPPPVVALPHCAEARSVQPHGGATRPWPAATPRPAHPVCVSPDADPRVRRRPWRPSP